MFLHIVRQFKHTLANLDGVLTKAEHYADVRKFDPNNFMAMRLAPDMFVFSRQVQVATDAAKGIAATLLKRDPPSYDDSEKTMSELHERLRKTIAFLDSLPEAELDKVKYDEVLSIKAAGQVKKIQAKDALLQRSLPNFFFHVSTAYNILRHAGVDIGKNDYLGKVNYIE